MYGIYTLFTLAYLVLLCRQFVLVKSCETGVTNQTIQVPCKKNITVPETRYKTVSEHPNCDFWDKIANIFDKRCNTRYSQRPYQENATREVRSQCDSVVCCTGYVMSAKTCVPGCPNGTYGVNCTQNCTCPAMAYPQCDKGSGNCTCLPGFMGNNCSDPCLAGYYGDDCGQRCVCHGNASCDRVSGDCNCTVPGWMGTYCDIECNDTFGLNCSEKCQCSENQTCDPVNGHCTCKPGRRGTNCSNECDEWTYGVDCQYTCSCDANTTKFCDKKLGTCQCLPGFVGQNCSDFCPMGFYGQDCKDQCSCAGTPYCDHINGTCICLGKHGENCSKDCDDGYFGPDCSRVCNCSGDHYNGTCHPYNGTCFCKTGWTGDTCSLKVEKEEYTDKQAKTAPTEDSFLTSDLMIAIISGCCGILLITIIIIAICVIRRRKQKCFDRLNVKQYNNAAYSDHIASDAQVIDENKQNDAEKSYKIILKDEVDDDTATVAQRNEMEMQNYSDNNVEMQENRTQANDFKVPASSHADTVDEVLKSKQQVLQDMHKNQEVTDGKSEIHPDVETDENSDHYSDIDSVKDEKEQRYSFVEIEKNESLDDPGQRFEDEEQYDSLENDTVKKHDILPDYSSFEEVRKETLNEGQVDTEDPYDKVTLTNETKKNTLTRNDYNTFNLTDKITEEKLNKDVQVTLGSSTKIQKSPSTDLSESIKSDLQTQESESEDSEYNSLDHTGKSFSSLKTSDNVYHTSEMLKPQTNATITSDSKAELDSEVNTDYPNEAQQGMGDVLIEEPEYNKLDHTGKSFRAAEVPFNVYDTNRIESAKTNPVRKVSTLKRQIAIEEENSEKQKSSANNGDTDDGSEYNSLDHTGKSFKRVNIPDEIYDNKTDKSRKDSNKSFSPIDVSISQSIGEEEEDSYSFCEIDDVDNEQSVKTAADDDAFIYEIPEISDDDLDKSDSHGTSEDDEKMVSKVKHKTKQRQIDDYEHYELTFGKS